VNPYPIRTVGIPCRAQPGGKQQTPSEKTKMLRDGARVRRCSKKASTKRSTIKCVKHPGRTRRATNQSHNSRAQGHPRAAFLALSASRMCRTDFMAKKPWISRDRGADYRPFVIQKLLIEKYFPCFKCRLSHRHVECEGLITPSEGCATYRIVISYDQNGAPRVKIREPQITPSSAIPHV